METMSKKEAARKLLEDACDSSNRQIATHENSDSIICAAYGYVEEFHQQHPGIDLREYASGMPDNPVYKLHYFDVDKVEKAAQTTLKKVKNAQGEFTKEQAKKILEDYRSGHSEVSSPAEGIICVSTKYFSDLTNNRSPAQYYNQTPFDRSNNKPVYLINALKEKISLIEACVLASAGESLSKSKPSAMVNVDGLEHQKEKRSKEQGPGKLKRALENIARNKEVGKIGDGSSSAPGLRGELGRG